MEDSTMKKFMRGVLFMLGAGLASSTQGGTITSGSFHASSFGVQGSVSATVSGENFTAQVTDTDAGPFIFNNFPPFQASAPTLSWAGDLNSGVLYNGVFYSVTDGFCCSQGPFASVGFSETLISPKPIVTGPGTYSLDLFSVTLNFTLRDSSGTLLHSETDTGFASGSITYTAHPGSTYLFADGFQATIIPEPIPEPSTWSLIAFAACCLGAFAVAQHARAVSSTDV
jgi:hypothetical protein